MGELEASRNLQKAAQALMESPGAMHLRTLQTIRAIAADPSEKIVLFIPSNFDGIAKTLLDTNKG
jgi:hypothetical protein